MSAQGHTYSRTKGGRGHTQLYKRGCRAGLHVHGWVGFPPRGLEEPWGPCDLRASRTRISGGNFTSTEHIFPPSTLLSSFSLPLLLFNLWFNFLKNGGRYRVGQCCENEAQLLGLHFENGPPTSFKPIVILLNTERKERWREESGRESYSSSCAHHLRPAHSRRRTDAADSWEPVIFI